ncbi:MAG: hypothetical protein IT293_00845 [Deltaproteobacteria bacterium]|nr:hypothetical protein [Deltaproteobacteria bacterium]
MRARKWVMGSVAVLALATVVVSCGGTGGGSGSKGDTGNQFILNSNNSGRLNLNVSPAEVDANKSDRIGLIATLSDSFGRGIQGVVITFGSDIDDITFLPADGVAVTDALGRADIIAVAGSTPTGTGAIVGTGAIFAQTPSGFGLRAQVPITLYDVGFIDAEVLGVIPSALSVVEPAPGQVLFFNIVGGTPPYQLKNEVSGIGAAVISQHCLPGCTENGGVLCVGSPCQSDSDCNVNASPTPAGVCAGPIKRCLASCAGTNCAGSRCGTDADCNDGSSTPANVCKDSGQSIAYIIAADPAAGTHGFVVEDSAAGAVNVEVTVSFVCGNGVASGDEQCDLGDLREQTCESLGQGTGILSCGTDCTFDFTNCTFATPTPGGGGGGATATPGGPTATSATGTPTPTPTVTPANTPTPGVGVPSNLALALLTNGSGDNGNGTLTTVIAATVTDTNGNPVPDGSNVFFNISGATQGAIVNSPSATNANPPCDVTNFETDTGVAVLNQSGVAHTCVTYPSTSAGTQITLNANSGAASDSQTFNLPPPPP